MIEPDTLDCICNVQLLLARCSTEARQLNLAPRSSAIH